MARERRSFTFLFTDIEGSTRMWASDEAAMSAAVARHDEIIRAAIESHGGRVFSTQGDAFAAAFDSAADALAAADDAQRALAREAWPTPSPLRVRMGLHTGEAEQRGGDYFGASLNLAARVTSAGHGGQILATSVIAASCPGPARDLGEHTLRDIEGRVRLLQLDDGAHPPLRVVDPDRVILPTAPTRLIGRDREVAEARRLLVDSRLVTITGVGGCGKTRVALEVAGQELPNHDAGVYFVDLSPVSNPADVPGAAAAALRILLAAGEPEQQLADYLADKNALVVLDNCEHVLDEAAKIAAAVLARPGASQVLCTSRELLGIAGERVLPLSGLDEASAVTLLEERAEASARSLPLADDEAVLEELCRRLDGMPLAIELAAARLGVLSPTEILVRLDDRFRLLTGTRRRNKTRTLEATLAWSYDLLDDDERWFFRRLGVFAGTFDLPAAAAVTALDELDAADVLEALISKSLVTAEPGAMGTRYRLLETLRAYAEAQLLAADESAAARDAHLAHYASFIAAAPYHVGFELDVTLIAAREREIDNMTAALDWACSSERWPDAVAIVTGLVEVWTALGVPQTGRAWITRVIDHAAEVDTLARDFLLWAETALAGVADEWQTAVALLVAALEIVGPEAEVPIRAQLAFIMSAVGDLDAAKAELARAQALNTHTAIPVDAFLQWVAGTLAMIEGDLVRARDEFARGAQGSMSTQLAFNVLCLAAAEIYLGGADAALRMVESREWDTVPIGSAGAVKAVALLTLGREAEGVREALTFARRATLGRIRRQANDALIPLAHIALLRGDADTARAILLDAGMPRSPHTVILLLHVARILGVESELSEAMDAVRASGTRHDAVPQLVAWLARLDTE